MFDGLTLNVQNSLLMSSFCEAVSFLQVPSIRLSEAVKIYKTTAYVRQSHNVKQPHYVREPNYVKQPHYENQLHYVRQPHSETQFHILKAKMGKANIN